MLCDTMKVALREAWMLRQMATWVVVTLVLAACGGDSPGTGVESPIVQATTTTHVATIGSPTTVIVGSTPSSTQPSTTTEPATTTTEPRYGLGIIPSEFRSAWNDVVTGAGMPQLLLPSLKTDLTSGPPGTNFVHVSPDSVLVAFTEPVEGAALYVLHLSLNRDGSVRSAGIDISFTDNPVTGADNPITEDELLMSWEALIRATTTPTSETEHATKVIEVLGLEGSFFYHAKTEVVEVGVKYTYGPGNSPDDHPGAYVWANDPDDWRR